MKKVYVLEYDNIQSYSDNEHYIVDIFENEVEANKAKDYYNKLNKDEILDYYHKNGIWEYDVIEFDLLDKFYKIGE